MTPRKRNMLEVFRADQGSTDSAHPGPPARRGVPGAGAGAVGAGAVGAGAVGAGARSEPAGGPLAEPYPRPAPGGEPDRMPPRSRGDSPARGEALPLLVPAGLAVLLLGFWLGRLSSGWWGEGETARGAENLAFETRTDDPAASRGSRTPRAPAVAGSPGSAAGAPGSRPAGEAPGTGAAAGEGYTADDLAFLDKRNRITLRAITFDATSSGQQKALASYHHMRANGVPAIAPFVAGDLTLICVGAAPSVQDPELARWRERLLTLPGPTPQGRTTPYDSAFLINIDDVVVRD